jgi:uncharacterized protein involved in exopolysaccharide biosynthesis
MNKNSRGFETRQETSLIAISTILHGVRSRWPIVIVCIGVLWLAGLAYHFITPREYTAQAEFYYVDSLGDGATRSASSGLASLAAVAGITPQQGSGKEIAIATLKSNQIAEQFIRKFNLLPTLFPENWNAATHQWRLKQIPSVADGVGRLARIRAIKEDVETGGITLAITLPDKSQPALLANGYVRLADEALRAHAMLQSTAAVNFLQTQVNTTMTVELKEAVIGIMQSQFLRMTESKTSPEFAFQVVDPATPPLTPGGPRLLLLLAILTVLGGLTGILITAFLELRAIGAGL